LLDSFRPYMQLRGEHDVASDGNSDDE